MLGKANKNLFRTDKLKSFAEGPAVSAHEEGDQHDQTSVNPVKGMDQAAHRMIFTSLNKFLYLFELFEASVPEFVRLIPD